MSRAASGESSASRNLTDIHDLIEQIRDQMSPLEFQKKLLTICATPLTIRQFF